ncbi:TRAP transporter small permease [Paracoccus mangrovi]|jgi:TRAP-type C4-dicarboxylate transport system permease small subunit|uniref:TRAP transporter small permease protein n=1 Tax=Paracoccus mangrovi TaxID=1715645 RepID=A0ABV7R2E7_9RHOB
MDRLDRLIWRLVDGAILMAVMGMVCLIALQVGSRLIGASVPWTEELSRFLFIWTVWLGLSASFRAGTHPALDMLPAMTTGRLRRLLGLIPALATTILFLAVTYYGYRLLLQQITFGEQSPILQVGMYWATLPLVLGSALSIFGVLTDAILGHDDPVTLRQAVPEHQGDEK